MSLQKFSCLLHNIFFCFCVCFKWGLELLVARKKKKKEIFENCLYPPIILQCLQKVYFSFYLNKIYIHPFWFGMTSVWDYFAWPIRKHRVSIFMKSVITPAAWGLHALVQNTRKLGLSWILIFFYSIIEGVMKIICVQLLIYSTPPMFIFLIYISEILGRNHLEMSQHLVYNVLNT